MIRVLFYTPREWQSGHLVLGAISGRNRYGFRESEKRSSVQEEVQDAGIDDVVHDLGIARGRDHDENTACHRVDR